MKKSEVIKLMKEGTHCIYVDNPEKRELLSTILSQAVCKTTNLTGVWRYYWIQNSFCICCEDIIPEQLEIINLTEIEPDNEKPYLFYEGEKYYFGDYYHFKDNPNDEFVSIRSLEGYSVGDEFPFKTLKTEYKYIRKIDHTAKYKKLLFELKEQAKKDGVNLKELI